ncbi:hypothetical protein [Streptomyces sp. NPDC051636]|uniref:hypothetical protein n=1 Tax=Streptomyces sp. NPDC051636 TaxID=3365663 RepID=UPI0037998AD9
MSAHSPAEWVAFLSLGVGGYAALSVPYFLLVDADLADFDPRPAMSRLVESGRLDPLLVAVANVWHDVRLSLREAAVSAAALLMLLSPASPEGAR